MQNWETISRALEHSGKTRDLRTLAESEDGQRLSRMLDGKAVEQAAKSGDSEALREILGQVLSTREGQRLAERVQKLMQK